MHLFRIIFSIFILIPSKVSAQTPTLNFTISLVEISESSIPNKEKDTIQTQKVSILLADSSLYVTKGNQRTVYDFSKEKIYFLNVGAKTYDETSLYAEIDYRRLEFFNRLKLKNILGNDGIENQVGSLFELESLFGIDGSKTILQTDLEELNRENLIKYSIESKPVAAFSFTDIALEDHSEIFLKYLLYETQIHPYIINTIIERKLVPEKMEFSFSSSGKSFKAYYQLDNYLEETRESDFGHRFFLFGYKSNKKLITNINKVYGYVHMNHVKFPDRNTVVESFQQHMKRKDYIAAFLTLTESNLATEIEYEEEFVILKRNAEKSRKFQEFILALYPAKDNQGTLEKIEYLEKILKKSKDQSSLYLVNAFLGSYYNNLGHKEDALRCFNKAISFNPYITSLYVDIGNIFAEQYNMRMAWKCYEIAIKLNAAHSMVKDVILKKVYLKRQYPSFFM